MKRRPAVVAVHSLDHVDFEVPNLDDAERFYRAFGLETSHVAGSLEVRASGDPRPWLFVHRGASVSKRLRYVSFGIFADDLPRFRERAASLGVTTIAPLAAHDAESLWFRDLHGVAVELRAAPKRTPDHAAPRGEPPPRIDRAAPLRSATQPVKPRRLSHALLFTPDLTASVHFYTAMLGLRLSDDAGAVAFMHAAHGSDHHVLAFAASTGPGLHHLAWVVDSLEDVGLGAMQMGEAGFPRGWGVGRHVLGSNYFYYVRDPWGSYCEYSFDIDHVPVEREWPASKQSPENGFYLWGPPPPTDFTTNFELESEAT
jgi:catechol 2,3-dioxygenase-like lactoylglutathione lyase family enzyme